jgi:hypothetical protein
MGMTTVRRDAPERPVAATYWRRRFVALVIGLSLLALITWAVSGALGGSAPSPDSAATQQVHGTLPGSPPASPGTRRGGAAGRSGQPQAHHGASQGSGQLRPCPASEVVLSVFSSQASYSARQTPEFEVDVVSTASQSCTFDIGARHVWLRIMAGPVRVWSSAECAEGEASLVTELRRGIPTIVPIGWDEQMSGSGCPGPGTPAVSGSYSAVASDGASTSSALEFRIA